MGSALFKKLNSKNFFVKIIIFILLKKKLKKKKKIGVGLNKMKNRIFNYIQCISWKKNNSALIFY